MKTELENWELEEIHLIVAIAEDLGYSHNFLKLEEYLPSILETAQRLAERAGSNIFSTERPPTANIPEEPAILLNRLTSALNEFMIVSVRHSRLEQITQQAYIATRFSTYSFKWEDAANRACEMCQLIFEHLEKQSVRVAKIQKWLQRAEEANQNCKEKIEPQLLYVRALLAQLEEQEQAAREYLTTMLGLYEEQKNLHGIVFSLIELGKFEEWFSGVEKAAPYFNRVLELTSRTDLEYYHGECFYRLGTYDFLNKDYRSAIEKLEKARTIGEKFGIRYLEAGVCRMLARTEEQLQNFQEAYNYAIRSLTLEKFAPSWEYSNTKKMVEELDQKLKSTRL